jgi:DME family drug/metabolite transporter
MITQLGLKGVLAIVIASFLWGTTGTAAQLAPDISPLAIGAFAMGLGGVLLCLTSQKHLVKDKGVFRVKLPVFLFGSACVALYPLAFYASMRFCGVAIGTVISIASAPLFAALFEYLFGKRIVTTRWLVSFLLGGVGIVLLAAGKATHNGVPHAGASTQTLGVALGLLAGLTYAGYSWAAKQLINSGAHSKSAMAGLFGCASLILLPSLLFTGDNLFVSPLNTFVSLYMAIIPMYLGYVLFGFGLRYVEVSQATLITLIEPVVATLFAIFFIGERFLPIGWIGMLFVCLCLIVQSIKTPGRLIENTPLEK